MNVEPAVENQYWHLGRDQYRLLNDVFFFGGFFQLPIDCVHANNNFDEMLVRRIVGGPERML